MYEKYNVDWALRRRKKHQHYFNGVYFSLASQVYVDPPRGHSGSVFVATIVH